MYHVNFLTPQTMSEREFNLKNRQFRICRFPFSARLEFSWARLWPRSLWNSPQNALGHVFVTFCMIQQIVISRYETKGPDYEVGSGERWIAIDGKGKGPPLINCELGRLIFLNNNEHIEVVLRQVVYVFSVSLLSSAVAIRWWKFSSLFAARVLAIIVV